MKKLITVAALFAAGTALSNAATVITLTNLSQDVSGDISYDASTGILSGSSMFARAGGTSGYYGATTTISLNLTALGMDSAESSFSGDAKNIVQYQQSATNTTSAIGLLANSSGLQFTWGGRLWRDSNSHPENFYISWDTLRGQSYTANGNAYVVLSIEAAYRLGSGNSNGNGTSVYTSSGGDFKWNNSSDSSTGNGFGFAGLTSSAAYNAIYVNTDYVSAVSVFSGAASTNEIATASQLVVVPEPSAFGLLAGIGALALVAARRRRK